MRTAVTKESIEKKAKLYAQNGYKALSDLRSRVDYAESIVADDF